MYRIKGAIIIHGPGRSGTTLLSDILSMHQELYWISSYVNKYPNLPQLSIANNLRSINAFKRYYKYKSKFPRPAEAYHFWEYYFKDFNSTGGRPRKSEIKEAIDVLHRIKKYTRGNRFITKLAGLSRADFLESVFDNPVVLWIDRKPEAVVMSYYKKRWGYKSKPQLFEALPKLQLIDQYCDRYKSYQNEKRQLKKFKLVQLYYEDLISDPISFFSKVCQKSGLPLYEGFKETIESWEIYGGSNEAYKKHLTGEELKYLEEKLLQASRELGYRS